MTHLKYYLVNHFTVIMLIVMGACLGLWSPSTQAQQPNPSLSTMGIISGQPATFPWVGALPSIFANEVNARLASAGQSPITWQTAFNVGDLNEGSTFAAMSAGAADFGFVLNASTVQNVPLTAFASAAPLLTGNPALASRAMDETHRRHPSLQQQWRQSNLVHLTSVALDSYQILRKTPITSEEELFTGHYIAPAAIARWFDGSRLKVSAVSFTDIIAAINAETTDGVIIPLSLAKAIGIIPSVPHLIQIDMAALPIGHLTVYAPKWDQMPELKRAALQHGARQYRDHVTSTVAIAATQAMQDVLLANGSIMRVNSETKIALANSLPNLMRRYETEQQDVDGTLVKTYQTYLTVLGQIPIRIWQ